MTDPKGALIETNAYDLRNRLTSRTDALNKQTSYVYDGVNNLSQRTDRKGQVTHFSYDANNRLSQTSDADGRTTNYTYDLAGNLLSVNDSVAGETLYRYDSLDRVIGETTDRGIVSYGYDAIGRLTQRTINGSDPNGTYLSTNIFEHYPQPIENNKRELTGW